MSGRARGLVWLAASAALNRAGWLAAPKRTPGRAPPPPAAAAAAELGGSGGGGFSPGLFSLGCWLLPFFASAAGGGV